MVGPPTKFLGVIQLHDADSEAIGDDRSLNLPSISVTVADMIEGLKRVADNRTLGEIKLAPDPAIQGICDGWPGREEAPRALDLGLPADSDLDSIIRAYIEDYVDS